jgi:acetyl-CoA acetyltransferase
VQCGSADVVVAGGVESMTRAPWVMAKPGTPWAKPGEVHDTALGWRFVNPRHDAEHTITLGQTAERVAALDGITREPVGRLRPAEPGAGGQGGGQRQLRRRDRAGQPRGTAGPRCWSPTTRPCGPPASSGSPPPTGVRRGRGGHRRTSSPLSDGASAVVVASEDAVRRLGLTPRARVLGSAAAGVPPQLMGLGPVPRRRSCSPGPG